MQDTWAKASFDDTLCARFKRSRQLRLRVGARAAAASMDGGETIASFSAESASIRG